MPTLFNGCGFDPPSPITVTSIWSWVGHPVSGLRLPTMALITLGFPTAPDLKSLTLPASAARRTVLQKVHRHTCKHSASAVCRHRVSGSLSLPSRGPFHLSFTVLSAIGHWVVFSLGGWSLQLHAGFLVSRATPDTAVLTSFRLRGFHTLRPEFPFRLTTKLCNVCCPLPRDARIPVWALPISLAATFGIDVSFSSSAYLDVSVQRVPSASL